MKDTTNTIVTPYDPSNPITNVLVKSEKGVLISDVASTPLKKAQINFKAYLLVQKVHYTVKMLSLVSPSSSINDLD